MQTGPHHSKEWHTHNAQGPTGPAKKEDNMSKTIGTVNGLRVTWSKANESAHIERTSIHIYNVKSEEDAINACKRNLNGFAEK